MSGATPADSEARQRALDISTSVIVQAPAGSGKTSLLTMRFLRLLSVVDAPEEVIAVTFTRKAAAEMRSRIVDALDSRLDDDLAQLGSFAEQVRQRDIELDWQLLANPARLRILTIDALCTSLTRQLPWTSGFGAPPGLLEDSSPTYRHTVRRFLARGDDGDDSINEQLRVLLTHFDNDVSSIERMLVRMLSHRDQWAEKIVGSHADWRAELEQIIARLVEHRLAELSETLEQHASIDYEQLTRVIAFAVEHATGNDSCPYDPASLHDRRFPLTPTIDNLAAWQALANLLLTKSKDVSLRKAFNKNLGFPAKNKHPQAEQNKEAIGQIVSRLAEVEGLVAQFDLIRRLPQQIEQEQWKLLQALQQLLPQLLAELHLSFTESGLVDYTEISLRAVSALGDASGPTELALRLDHRISHVLVDEFQDTSSIQFNLITRLIRGWQPGDGRTLFLVGDPMQSIYRFRKADVQLFLNVWQHGVGDVELQQETVSVNFRSRAGIVNWVNDSFTEIFPARSDALEGAVNYAPSTPWHAADDAEAVSFHPQRHGDPVAEARLVVELVEQELALGRKVAILIRNRSHLAQIVPALQQAQRPFQGLELVKLWDHETIQDLFALTRACQHPGDRVAWLALLRAPWCGLKLHDLHTLVHADEGRTIIESLRLHGDRLEDRDRVMRVLPLLEHMLAQRRRGSLRRLVQWLWTELGGPACVDDAAMADAQRYFDMLESVEIGGVVASMSELEDRLRTLYASPQPDPESERLQIMTIYKSKGLEFDSVILPRLGARARADEAELVRLTEVAIGHDEVDFLIAPRPRAGAQSDPLYDLSGRFNRDRADNELDRLLYVACTRARIRLHLLGAANFSASSESFSPARSSLLARMWPLYKDRFGTQQRPLEAAAQEVSAPVRSLSRLPNRWCPPEPPPPVIRRDRQDIHESVESIEYSWAGEQARQLGIVVHEVLLNLSQQGGASWTPDRIEQAQSRWRAEFRRAGASEQALEALLARTTRAVRNTLDDDTGRWIISTDHSQARSEYQFTAVVDGVAAQFAVDRTFVDADGSRWIIDYKTSRHAGGDVEAFLETEKQRYLAQMTRYAEAFSMLDSEHPIRLGLYFPLLQRFVSWDHDASGVN